MSPRDLSPFVFIGNHRALDFVNTEVAAEGVPCDLLGDLDDLVGWLVQAGALDGAAARAALARWGSRRRGESAVEAARERPALAVGLHLTAVCGRAVLPAAEVPRLVDGSGRFSQNPVAAGLRYAFSRAAQREMEGEMRAPISAQYLRAIAKVAFHFFIEYFTQFSGLEREFDDVKQYIYLGDAQHAIVSPLREPFVRELQDGGRMKRWGHLLSAECSEQHIEARLQFFAGPQVEPIVWRVLIGKNPARIIYKQAGGYAYLYFEDVGGEYHGERVDLTPIGRILIPTDAPTLRFFGK